MDYKPLNAHETYGWIDCKACSIANNILSDIYIYIYIYIILSRPLHHLSHYIHGYIDICIVISAPSPDLAPAALQRKGKWTHGRKAEKTKQSDIL